LMGIDAQEKALRSAMQGAAQGQQPPKPTVVDQELAQMGAPSAADTGIGTLPQQPMQMAEGGIVTFDDGGGVMDRLSAANAAQRARTEGLFGNSLTEEGRERQRAQFRNFFGLQQAGLGDDTQNMDIQPPAMQDSASSNADRGNFPGQGATGTAIPTNDGGLKALAPPAPTGAPRAAEKPADLASQYKSIRGAMKDTDPYAAETSEVGEMGVKAAKDRKAEREADIAKFDKAYEGREGRLGKREAELGKQKDTNTGLALLNAGLTIMSTPGGLATAIGKGARVGTEQFAAGLDKIRAAQERLDDARDKAEDLKLSRAEMSAKEIRDANSEIRTAQIDAKKLGTAGLRDAGAKNDKVAGSLFDATAKQQLERESMASRERAAQTTASAYSAGRLGVAEDRLALDRQKAQLASLQKTLESTSKHTPAGKLQRAQLERDMETLRNQIAGGTMPAPSAVGAPGGSILNFDAMGNLVK
jgi:hypothetical protein